MSATTNLDELREAFVKVDVEYFSQAVFGLPYSDVKKTIYPKKRYKNFFIRKRSGSLRLIQEPRRALKKLQHTALAYLQESANRPKPCVHGFVKKRSIVSNARVHCDRKTHHLLNVDIEDFFHSISFFRVRGALQKAPFNFGYPVATMLAHLCTFNGVLPQGAPTSPFLSNVICRSLDRDLMLLAQRHRANYSRYADDMTFSFSVRSADRLPSNLCSLDGGAVLLGAELVSIIEFNGFRVNSSKTRISSRRQRLEVTGLTINEFPNVKRAFIDTIRGALHSWERYGYDAAQAEWERRNTSFDKASEQAPWKRQTRLGVAPNLRNTLRGRLLYLRMIRGKFDSIYTRLADRYNTLCVRHASESEFPYVALPVEQLVLNQSDARKAVFVIEWSGDHVTPATGAVEAVGGQGTAFLYRNFGLVTCDHILVGELSDGQQVDMRSPNVTVHEFKVIDSMNKAWPVIERHRDTHRDLALLSFSGERPTVRHFVPVEDSIFERERGYITGYPDWSAGRPVNFTPAEVVVSFPRQGLRRFEISTSIRRGNSGGPFLDTKYRVAGVGQRGASQTSGSDECLHASELDSWLATLAI